MPVIIAHVLNQGPQEWTISTSFEDQFALDEADELSRYVPKFEHGLEDLASADPLKKDYHEKLQIALRLLQLARRKDELLDYFVWLDANFPLLPTKFLRLLLLYALHVQKSLDAQKLLRQNLKSHNLKGATMTTAEILKAEGRAEGRAEGKREGKREGKLEGLLVSVTTFERVLRLPITPVTVLEAMSLTEVEELLDRLQAQFDAMQDR